MDRLLALVRRYPIASVAAVVGIAAIIYLLTQGGAAPTPPTVRETPAPAASPAPPAPPQAAPAAPPSPAPAAAVPAPEPQAAGRADPFVPLVRARVGPAPGPAPVSLPPPAPLPPPLFPGPEASPGVAVPTPPPPPPRLSTGAQLIGVLGDTGRVAIIKIGGQVYVVAQGEMIQDKIRVELVDATGGVVVLIEDGERFEVRFS